MTGQAPPRTTSGAAWPDYDTCTPDELLEHEARVQSSARHAIAGSDDAAELRAELQHVRALIAAGGAS